MQQNNTDIETPWSPSTNSGQSAVIITNHEQIPPDTAESNPIYIKENASTPTYKQSAEEIVFIRLVSQGMTYTSAYRKAFPLKNKRSYDYIRRLAHELGNRADIKSEIATVKETRAKLARLAEDRIEQILTVDDSSAKGSKVAEVAMFIYDHANGKAKQSVEVTSKSVSVNINLTQSLTDTEH